MMDELEGKISSLPKTIETVVNTESDIVKDKIKSLFGENDSFYKKYGLNLTQQKIKENTINLIIDSLKGYEFNSLEFYLLIKYLISRVRKFVSKEDVKKFQDFCDIFDYLTKP